MTPSRRGRLLLAGLTSLVGIAGTALGPTAAAHDAGRSVLERGGPDPYYSELEKPPTVIGSRRIGTSVNDRPIMAYHLGNPKASRTAVVLGSMHGDEKAGIAVVDALRRGEPVTHVNLWVVPTINPDGVAADRRQNAHGVDLNRNFGHDWAPLTGEYYSGPEPWSEPETRAFRRFLDDVDPTFVVSFHQPLYGVGRTSERQPFLRRLSRGLDLPIRSFNCTGKCYGTMTSWFNATHAGTAVTVEFGSSPSLAYLRGRAARGTVAAVLGRYW